VDANDCGLLQACPTTSRMKSLACLAPITLGWGGDEGGTPTLTCTPACCRGCGSLLWNSCTTTSAPHLALSTCPPLASSRTQYCWSRHWDGWQALWGLLLHSWQLGEVHAVCLRVAQNLQDQYPNLCTSNRSVRGRHHLHTCWNRR